MERGQIKNIISRMNLKEKISQLCSIPSIEVRMDGSKVEIENLEEKIAWGIGSFQLPARNFPPEISARINNEIQRRVMEKSRFHIPALIQEECLSGQVAKGASMFPKPIGLACTFHTELVSRFMRRWEGRQEQEGDIRLLRLFWIWGGTPGLADWKKPLGRIRFSRPRWVVPL